MKHQRFRVVKIVVKSLILLLYLFVFTILYSSQEFSKLKVCFMKNKWWQQSIDLDVSKYLTMPFNIF